MSYRFFEYKKQDLKRVLDLAIARMRGKEETIDIDKHQENEDTQILSDRIFIKQSERMVKVYLKDILFVEAERSYCRIITAKNKYLLSVPLKKIAKKLCEDQFIRVHRSFIINLDEVDEVLNSHTIISKHLIPLGKSYRNDFLKRFQSL